jgi:hypothetical protein
MLLWVNLDIYTKVKQYWRSQFGEELDWSVSFLIGFFLGIPFCEGMRKIGLPYEMTEQEGMIIVKN